MATADFGTAAAELSQRYHGFLQRHGDGEKAGQLAGVGSSVKLKSPQLKCDGNKWEMLRTFRV